MVNLNTTTTNNTLPHQKQIEFGRIAKKKIFYSNFKEKKKREWSRESLFAFKANTKEIISFHRWSIEKQKSRCRGNISSKIL